MAFTLAETLITLLVIGVVAALTIPALMQQIGDYTLQKQKDVFSKKWAEGLRQMRVDGKLENSYTTAEFVNEMGKYFKISAVCDSNNLSGCFAEKITSYENGEAEEFDVKDLKSAKNFNKSEEDSPVYGIRFSDGTNMLLAYKKDCKGISEGETQGNHTSCLLYVYDVNANKSPNSYGGNTGSSSEKSDTEKSSMNKDRDMIGNVSMSKENLYGLSFQIAEIAPNDMKWADADKYCKDKGYELPTRAQLSEIATKLYVESGVCTKITSITESRQFVSCNETKLKSLPLWQTIEGGTNRLHTYWTSEVNQGTPYVRDFGSNITSGGRAMPNLFEAVMCVR